MRKLVKQRLVVAWIALLALLFAALSPAVAQAMTPAAAVTEQVQLCTAQGMITVVVDMADAGKPAPAPGHMAKHCPYCVTHGGAPLLPPAQAFVFPILLRQSAHPPLYDHAATPSFAWTAAHPRAPPALA